MKPYYEHGGITIYHRDVLEVLAEMPADSVDCAVTSPPYWGLRKYAGEQGKEPYGLEPTPELYIEHTMTWMRALRRVLRSTGTLWLNLGDSYSGSWANMSHPSSAKWPDGRPPHTGAYKPLDLCQIPEQVVLAAKGMVCIPATRMLGLADALAEARVNQDWAAVEFFERVLRAWGLGQAIADGYYLRSVIIWQKPNPMPESVQGWAWVRCQKRSWAYNEKTPELRRDRQPGRDFGTPTIIPCPGCPKCEANDGYVLRKGSGRPTSSFEYLYMLTKTSDYYFDTEAVREPLKPSTKKREVKGYNHAFASQFQGSVDDKRYTNGKQLESVSNPAGRNIRNVWTITTKPFSLELCQDCKRIYDQRHFRRLEKPEGKRICRCGSTSWLSHFATFPPDLVRPCILASTSAKGNCPECGMPWARVIEKGLTAHDGLTESAYPVGSKANRLALLRQTARERGHEYKNETQTLGWRPTCRCFGSPQQIAWDVRMGLSEYEPVPAVVLDPFSGSGTTLVVAKELGRHGIGIDLAEDYHRLAQYRLERTQPGLL